MGSFKPEDLFYYALQRIFFGHDLDALTKQPIDLSLHAVAWQTLQTLTPNTDASAWSIPIARIIYEILSQYLTMYVAAKTVLPIPPELENATDEVLLGMLIDFLADEQGWPFPELLE